MIVNFLAVVQAQKRKSEHARVGREVKWTFFKI